MFSRIKRVLLNSNKTIKQKEFLTEAIRSDKFETRCDRNLSVVFSLSFALILLYHELKISKMNLEREEGFIISRLKILEKVNLRSV